MCIAYSGRCTLSNHMTARDSNRGGCCQSCRWDYDLYQLNEEEEVPLFEVSGCSICDESKRFKVNRINSNND